jgi:hypothetical protein
MDSFTVDIALDEAWLEAALKTAKSGKIVRATVVITDAGPNAKYKAAVLGGGDCEYIVCSVAGDFTKEPAWQGVV